MFERNFDPYDLLIQVNDRLQRLEQAHNAMARDYSKTQTDLAVTLNNYRNLQRSHLALADVVMKAELDKLSQK